MKRIPLAFNNSHANMDTISGNWSEYLNFPARITVVANAYGMPVGLHHVTYAIYAPFPYSPVPHFVYPLKEGLLKRLPVVSIFNILVYSVIFMSMYRIELKCVILKRSQSKFLG